MPKKNGNDLVKRVVVQESNVREGTAQLRVTIPKDIASVCGWEKGADEKPQQLYRVDEDPREEHNVFGEHPKLEKELTELIKQTVANGRSTPGPAQQNDVPVDWTKFLGDMAK